MSLDVGHCMAGGGCDRLQRPDLVGDQVLDFGRLHAGDRAAAEAVQMAVARMPPDADAGRVRTLSRLAHDIGIAGMEAAGDVDRGGKLDHGGVIAHFPRAKSFAEIAIEIDGRHVVSPLSSRFARISPAPARPPTKS